MATRLGIPFVDADAEIEKAAGMTITDIFAIRGEAEFRAGEARVITRLLEGGPQVLATGGGAFANPDTRAVIAAKGISIWLKAEFEVLMKRIKRRHDRPLLKTDDPGATIAAILSPSRTISADRTSDSPETSTTPPEMTVRSLGMARSCYGPAQTTPPRLKFNALALRPVQRAA